MSRCSGAGAYSHGIACPSPSPQLLGVADVDDAGTTLDSVRVAIAANDTARTPRAFDPAGRGSIGR